DSYWKLLELAPEHPAAAEVAPALDAAFKARADQARDLMSKAQQAAEKAQASKTEQFGEGTKLASRAEASYRARAYARAAREYMQARDHFRRALR
ncbi:MAG TPA: hypothetical protein VIC87_10460, partial [Vicinamibacteria bacterium]